MVSEGRGMAWALSPPRGSRTLPSSRGVWTRHACDRDSSCTQPKASGERLLMLPQDSIEKIQPGRSGVLDIGNPSLFVYLLPKDTPAYALLHSVSSCLSHLSPGRPWGGEDVSCAILG